MRCVRLSTALLLTLLSVSACGTSLPASYCASPILTPKAATFDGIEASDPVFAEQIYGHWAMRELCE